LFSQHTMSAELHSTECNRSKLFVRKEKVHKNAKVKVVPSTVFISLAVSAYGPSRCNSCLLLLEEWIID